MTFINVGAYGPDGNRVPTKKRLRELLRDNPEGVLFDRTSLMDEGKEDIRGDRIPSGITLSVVLPNPYTDRRSYATVVRTAQGGAKVS